MLTNSHEYLRPADDAERNYLESLVREDFSWCHPGETLDDLRRRAPFSREDQGLLREWMEFAALRAAMRKTAAQADVPFAEAAEIAPTVSLPGIAGARRAYSSRHAPAQWERPLDRSPASNA